MQAWAWWLCNITPPQDRPGDRPIAALALARPDAHNRAIAFGASPHKASWRRGDIGRLADRARGTPRASSLADAGAIPASHKRGIKRDAVGRQWPALHASTHSKEAAPMGPIILK